MSERLSVDHLEEAFRTVREKIASAAGDRQVTLLAATKTVPAERINDAVDHLGLCDIGENRVQELLSKYDDLHKENLRIHFIGRLQTNKVKYIIDKVCLIHSLDSVGLATEIEKQAAKHQKQMDVLIELNLAGEASKGGISVDQLPTLLDFVKSCPHIRVCGIMVIPPATGDEERLQGYFNRAKEEFDRLSGEGAFSKADQPILSMGMSDSYVTAVKCGSTLVRIGSALFGKRDYSKTEKSNQENM
ncbi:MAG: YggS family pyridoxal phosphate-dependent enzyme [Eubacteriales bacterium]